MFDPVFSDPPLLPLSPFHLMIEHSIGNTLHMPRVFIFLGRVHVTSTGPISTVQTKGQVLCNLIGQ
ncbi:unnamed protein product [Staurois parvus]|uniref:Uncharacterized protein n=1 Tax=Staurois parvus TaxID=386267 RepID=A0ABN9DEQ2_9NEOB|nr:unnamed protein product [Staurois parvus]